MARVGNLPGKLARRLFDGARCLLVPVEAQEQERPGWLEPALNGLYLVWAETGSLGCVRLTEPNASRIQLSQVTDELAQQAGWPSQEALRIAVYKHRPMLSGTDPAMWLSRWIVMHRSARNPQVRRTM